MRTPRYLMRTLSIKPPVPKNFGWYIKWNEPFPFGPTGIFGTSFEDHFDQSGNFGRSVGPKYHCPFAEIVVPSTALLYSAFTNN